MSSIINSIKLGVKSSIAVLIMLLLFKPYIAYAKIWAKPPNAQFNRATNGINVTIGTDTGQHLVSKWRPTRDTWYGKWYEGYVQGFSAAGIWWLHVKSTSSSSYAICGPYIKEDAPPYAPTITSVSNRWVNYNVSVSMHDNGDRGSTGIDSDGTTGSTFTAGVSRVEYRIDNGNWYTFSGSLSISNEGWHNVYGRVIDTMKNIGDTTSKSFGIDKTPPSGQNPRLVNITDTGLDVYIDQVKDALSGVNRVSFEVQANGSGYKWFNGTNNGNGQWHVHIGKSSFSNIMDKYHARVHIYDNAGNESVYDAGTKSLINRNGYVTTDIPSQLNSNTNYTFRITTHNTGNQTWNEANHYRLGTDGSNYPGVTGRLYLPSGVNVGPGQSYTWTISFNTGNKPSYTFKYRMLQENITWFGSTYTKDVKVVPYAHKNNAQISNNEYTNGSIYWAKAGNPFTVRISGYSDFVTSEYKINGLYALFSPWANGEGNFSKWESIDGFINNSQTSSTSVAAGGSTWDSGVSSSGGSITRSGNSVSMSANLASNIDGADYRINPMLRIYDYGVHDDSKIIRETPWAGGSAHVKIDGLAPTGYVQAYIDYPSPNIKILAQAVSDNGGSGVNSLYAVLTDPATQQKKTVPMTKVNDETWSATTNAFVFNGTQIKAEVYAKDNVGNTSKLYTNLFDLLSVSCNLKYSPAKQGQQIIFDIKTTGYAKYLKVYLPSDITSLDKTGIHFPLYRQIKEEPFHEENIPYILPLKTPLTLNADGRIRQQYSIMIEASRDDGSKANTTVYLDVKDNVLDGIKTEIIGTGYDADK